MISEAPNFCSQWEGRNNTGLAVGAHPGGDGLSPEILAGVIYHSSHSGSPSPAPAANFPCFGAKYEKILLLAS